ncbi:MAG TPA: hypothetical protein VNU93_02070, partial [Verrucomicrobiae bacterium]|nr:hypothetical protein [Verrucomicrobiae bacterium]
QRKGVLKCTNKENWNVHFFYSINSNPRQPQARTVEWSAKKVWRFLVSAKNCWRVFVLCHDFLSVFAKKLIIQAILKVCTLAWDLR